MNLLSSLDIAAARQAMKDVFDTFKRDSPVRFYKEADVVYVNDPDYDANFQRANQKNKNQKTAVWRDIPCRVIYLDLQPFDSFIKGDDTNVRFKGEYNRVQIQFEIEHLAFFEGTTRFVFEGEKFARQESLKKQGILGSIDYGMITLKRVE